MAVIRLSKRAELRLDALAARTGRTKALLVRELTRKMLRQLEESYLAATAGETHEGTEEAGPTKSLATSGRVEIQPYGLAA